MVSKLVNIGLKRLKYMQKKNMKNVFFLTYEQGGVGILPLSLSLVNQSMERV